MLNALYQSINSLFTYLDTNVSCLLYGAQLTASKSLLFASYFDLLVDLAEAFGVWTVLSILILTALTALVVIQQIIGFMWETTKTTKTTNFKEDNLNTVTYRLFTRFAFLFKIRQ